MMPRMLSIPVCKLDSPAASRRAMTPGTCSIVSQRSWICWRVVDVGHVAATRSRDLGEQPKLAGREDPVGHADPQS